MLFSGSFVQKNAISDSKNGCNFPRLRSFEDKFADKVPLNPSNFPPSFVGITRTDWEKSAKM